MRKAIIKLLTVGIFLAFGATGCWLGTCDNDSTRVCDGSGCMECDVDGCYPAYCSDDADCDIGEYCEPLEGVCYPKAECTNDWDCPEPMVCDEGTGECTVRTPENVCTSDWDCPENSYCDEYSGRCLPALECSTSADCPNGYYCDGEHCIQRPDESCGSNAECGIGAYCDNGQCVNSSTCTDDAECGNGFTCDDRGTCVPGDPIVACSTNADCEEGYQCVDGQCASVPPREPSWECQFDEQCGGGICYDGRCYAQCTGNDDCPTGQVCHSDGYCIDAGAGTECVANADCGQGQVCVNGWCHESCADDGQCADEKDFCLDGVCMPDDRARPQCYTKADCEGQGLAGYDCVEGICRVPCVDDGDCQACPGNPICSEGGYCVDEHYANPECSSETDCPAGRHCQDGVCVDAR